MDGAPSYPRVRTHAAGAAAALASVLVVVSTTGCHLLADYGDKFGQAGPPDTSDEVETRDAADGADTPVDTRGAPDGRTGDTSPGGDAVDSETGLPPNRCPAAYSNAQYRVRPASDPGSVQIDGFCSSEEFQAAATVRFDVNTTDNSATCKFVWRNATPDDRIHGCCRVQDDLRHADAKPGDPPDEIWEPNGSGDDRIEHWFKCNLEETRDGCSYKTFLNARDNGSGTPTFFAARYRPTDGSKEFTWDAEEVARVRYVNNPPGYVLEWESNLGFEANPGTRGLCQFAVFDVDQSSNGEILTFGPERSINEPDEWGCCYFE